MNFLTLLGFGAFLSGVALFYLVMQRTRKHRMQAFEASERERLHF